MNTSERLQWVVRTSISEHNKKKTNLFSIVEKVMDDANWPDDDTAVDDIVTIVQKEIVQQRTKFTVKQTVDPETVALKNAEKIFNKLGQCAKKIPIDDNDNDDDWSPVTPNTQIESDWQQTLCVIEHLHVKVAKLIN